MASPVDTSVKHFTSAMLAAPVLSGTAGALINILDACLVTGFDLKTATSLVVASGVATLSYSGTHSATVDSVVLVENASIVALNGEQRVTSVAAGVVRFATAAANGTATGAITFKMAPAGWAKSFTGTNLAAYRSTDATSTGMYLRVDDTVATSCRVVGYEQMTDINTGIGQFPTNPQQAGGGYWGKSSAADMTANNWYIFADSRMLIIHTCPSIGQAPTCLHGFTQGFGDGQAVRPGGDPYMCFLTYSVNPSAINNGDGALDTGGNSKQRAFPREYTGLGTCVLHNCYSYIANNPNSTSGNDSFFGPFPSVIDGGLRLCKRYFSTGVSLPPRGDLPGLYFVPMNLAFDSFKVRDVIPGTGPLSGRKMFCLNPIFNGSNSQPSSASTGVSFVDITGPWR